MLKPQELELILNRIDKSEENIKSDMKEFRENAETKINNMGAGIKDDMSNKINGVNGRLEKFDKRLERIENRDKILEKHGFKIDEIEKDLNSLGIKQEKDIKEVKEIITGHLKIHERNTPKKAVTLFKIKTIWYVYGFIGLAILGGMIKLAFNYFGGK
jgi:hypothetical protein